MSEVPCYCYMFTYFRYLVLHGSSGTDTGSQNWSVCHTIRACWSRRRRPEMRSPRRYRYIGSLLLQEGRYDQGCTCKLHMNSQQLEACRLLGSSNQSQTLRVVNMM